MKTEEAINYCLDLKNKGVKKIYPPFTWEITAKSSLNESLFGDLLTREWVEEINTWIKENNTDKTDENKTKKFSEILELLLNHFSGKEVLAISYLMGMTETE